MKIEEFFKESILQKLFDAKNEEFEHYISKTPEDKEKRNKIEKNLKALLTYVDGEHYEYVKKEMDEILWQMMEYAGWWNELYYKLGIIDGVKLDKEIKEEIKEEMEKMLNGKI